MRAKQIAVPLAALIAAYAAAARGEDQQPRPKSWFEHVRFHALTTLRDLGRELDSMTAAMRKGMTRLRDDTAHGIASVTREGRRGLASASKGLAQAAETVRRETHGTFIAAGRTIVPGVASQPAAKAPAAVTEMVQSPILAPHFLRGHDIVLAWHLNVGDRPVHATALFDDCLIVETKDQDVYSFEPATGILQWLFNLPGGSQCRYTEDPHNILVIARDVYYELDRLVGRPRRRIVLPFPASSAPAIRGTDVIIGSWERRVIALDRETRRREWAYNTDENVVAAAAPAPDLVYIADTGGELIGYSTVTQSARWTYKAHDGFRVTPVIHLIDVILPAEDLFVHAVNRFSGLSRWKYPVQGQVKQPVWVTEDDVVYFSAEGDAFYAVSYKDGKLLWRCPKGGWPVAVGRENIYIQGEGSEVWCLDRKTGQKKWAVSAAPFTHFVRNTISDHIYLCTDAGQVYALYLRGDHLEKKKAPAPGEKPPAPKEKRPEEPEPGGEPSLRPVPSVRTAPPAPAPKEVEERE